MTWQGYARGWERLAVPFLPFYLSGDAEPVAERRLLGGRVWGYTASKSKTHRNRSAHDAAIDRGQEVAGSRKV